MEINFEDVTLRDMVATDIEDDICWNTVETRWMDWDAPWEEDEPFDADKYRDKQMKRLAKPRDENGIRYEFEVDYKGRHIGSVNAYFIDENYKWAREGRIAIGIDINEPEYWGKGIGGKVFAAYINYLFSMGYEEIYTQTWSGNKRMTAMAKRLGFVLCHRVVDEVEVWGKTYDVVTMRLGRDLHG